MYKLYLVLIFFGFSPSLVAQTFEGTVYGSEHTIAGVVIKNLRTSRITTTDNQGRFSIAGKVKDTLTFQYFTYEDKIVVLDEKDTSNFVVELTAIVNLLDEVVLAQEKKFNAETFTTTFKSDIARDMELHPEKYQVNTNTNGNLNFISIGRVLVKLIRGNKPPKKKPKPVRVITLDEYINLFENDAKVNDTFLLETLKIAPDKKPLFIDYCISQQLDAVLLEQNNTFLLMDKLVLLGKEFLELEDDR